MHLPPRIGEPSARPGRFRNAWRAAHAPVAGVSRRLQLTAYAIVHAAVLVDQLDLLDKQNVRRSRSADHLTARLSALGLSPQATSAETTERSYYRYAVRLPEEVLAVAPVDRIARALTAELGFAVVQTHRPLNDNPLNRPSTRRGFALDREYAARANAARFDVPIAKRIQGSVVSFGHEVLLAPLDAIGEIAVAFEKVLAHVGEPAG